MSDDLTTRLRALMDDYNKRHAAGRGKREAQEGAKQRAREACDELITNVVLPVLQRSKSALQRGGHDVRVNNDKTSVSLSMTPRGGGSDTLSFACEPPNVLARSRGHSTNPPKPLADVTREWVEEQVTRWVETVFKRL